MNISLKNVGIEIYKMFGNLKFAVFIILIFASALCFGTFQESYHGTDYANRLVYKSNGFFLLQFSFAQLIHLRQYYFHLIYNLTQLLWHNILQE